MLPVSPMLVPELVGVDAGDDQAGDDGAIKGQLPSTNPSCFFFYPSSPFSSASSSSSSMAFDTELRFGGGWTTY